MARNNMETLNQQAVEAVREYYLCKNRIYKCEHYSDCQFGKGSNAAFDCCECTADIFYEGVIYAINKLSDGNKG